MPGEPPARDRTQRVDAGPRAASTAAQRLGWAAVAVALVAVIVAAVGLHDIHGHLRRISNALDQQTAAQQRLESTLGHYSANLATALLTGEGRDAVEPGGEPARLRLPCLTEGMVGRIKADPSAVAGAFADCAGELSDLVGERLGPLAEPDRFAIFATLVAFHWAPYGAGAGITMQELRTQTVMQCAQYAALTGHLLRHGPGQDGVRLRFVGLEGPAVLNHAQLFYSRAEVKLLLDPTIGLIAAAGFDEVMRGIPVKPSRILDFYDRTEIASFRDRVVTALTRGLYRPSDLLYYYEGIYSYLVPATVRFPTPGGTRLRARTETEAAEPAASGEP